MAYSASLEFLDQNLFPPKVWYETKKGSLTDKMPRRSPRHSGLRSCLPQAQYIHAHSMQKLFGTGSRIYRSISKKNMYCNKLGNTCFFLLLLMYTQFFPSYVKHTCTHVFPFQCRRCKRMGPVKTFTKEPGRFSSCRLTHVLRPSKQENA